MQDVNVQIDESGRAAVRLRDQAAAIPQALAADEGAAAGTPVRTAQELAGVRRIRDDLVQQLTATHARRSELVGEIESTDPGGRGVLKQQMAELDHRVLRLETAVSNLDHAIASAPPSVAAADRFSGASAFVRGAAPRGFYLLGPNGPSPNAVPALLLLITLLQLVLLLRGRARRAGASPASEALARESAARLARVEQAVDAIAVEVERVSEGQRYVTRVLGDQPAPVARSAPAPRQHQTPA